MKKTIGKFLMLTALAGTISSGFAMKMKKLDEASEVERGVIFGTNCVTTSAILFNPTYKDAEGKDSPTVLMQLVVDRFQKNEIIKELIALEGDLRITKKDAFFNIIDDLQGSDETDSNVHPQMIQEIKEVTEQYIGGNMTADDLNKFVVFDYLSESKEKSEAFQKDVVKVITDLIATKEKIAVLEAQMSTIESRSAKFISEDLNYVSTQLFNSFKPEVERTMESKCIELTKDYNQKKAMWEAKIAEAEAAKLQAEERKAPEPVKSNYVSRYGANKERGESAQKPAQQQTGGYVSKYAKVERAPEPAREPSPTKPVEVKPAQQSTGGYVSKYAKREETASEQRRELSAPKTVEVKPAQQQTGGYVSKYRK